MTTRFHLSVRAVILAIAAMGAAIAAVHAQPSFQSIFVMNALTIAFTTAVSVAAIQATGNTQAFCVGTAAVLGCALAVASRSWGALIVAVIYDMVDYPKIYGGNDFLSWFWCAAPINGVIASFLGWFLTPRTSAPVSTHSIREKPDRGARPAAKRRGQTS